MQALIEAQNHTIAGLTSELEALRHDRCTFAAPRGVEPSSAGAHLHQLSPSLRADVDAAIVVDAAGVSHVNVKISSQLSPDQKNFAAKTTAIIKRQIMTRCNASVIIGGASPYASSTAEVILQINASLSRSTSANKPPGKKQHLCHLRMLHESHKADPGLFKG